MSSFIGMILAHHEMRDKPFWALLVGAVVFVVIAKLAKKKDQE